MSLALPKCWYEIHEHIPFLKKRTYTICSNRYWSGFLYTVQYSKPKYLVWYILFMYYCETSNSVYELTTQYRKSLGHVSVNANWQWLFILFSNQKCRMYSSHLGWYYIELPPSSVVKYMLETWFQKCLPHNSWLWRLFYIMVYLYICFMLIE